MSAVAVIEQVAHLPSLIDRAASALTNARTAAEVLEAREYAGLAYDAAKRAGRLAKAKQAHDDLIAAAFRAQADALEIEAGAKRRLADEYDAAQERGEVRSRGNPIQSGRTELPGSELVGGENALKDARQFRDAERNSPGIARRALDAMLDSRQEPTKAALREAVLEAARQGYRGGGQSTPSKNPLYEAPTESGKAWSHVYGTCRAFAEWASEENLRLAQQGRFERRDDQSRNIAAVRRAIAALSEFERLIDAH